MRQASDKELAALSSGNQGFDYSQIERSVAIFLQGQALRLRRSIGKSLIQFGKELIEAKRYLCHGSFVVWVEQEVGIPARTAQGYMKIARWAHGKGANVMQLAPSLLYLLSAQTTPEEVVTEVLSLVEGGQTVSLSSVRERIRDLRGPLGSEPQHAQERQSENELHRTTKPKMSVRFDWTDDHDDLLEVMEILSRSLPHKDRRRVCEIMISPALLHDANLPRRLVAAFARLLPYCDAVINGTAIAPLPTTKLVQLESR
jgi:hypothetical protein